MAGNAFTPQPPTYDTMGKTPAAWDAPEPDIMEIKVPERHVFRTAFRLSPDPHVYRFSAPKIAVALMPVLGKAGGDGMEVGVAQSSFEWLGQGLSEDDNKRIVARLEDPEDGLDFDTLGEIVRGLMERVGQRPTT